MDMLQVLFRASDTGWVYHTSLVPSPCVLVYAAVQVLFYTFLDRDAFCSLCCDLGFDFRKMSCIM